MIRFFYPLLAGGLLGLLGQPVSGWWLGFLWAPFYYFFLLSFRSQWATFAFTFTHAFIASFWAWDSLFTLQPGGLGNLFAVFLGTSLMALPLFLGFVLVNQVVAMVKANQSQMAYYQFLSFPIAHYIGVKLFLFFPLGEIPLPGLSAQSFTMSLFGDSYPVIGELATESLVLSLFALVILPFISREDTKKLFLLPFVCLFALLFTNFAGDFKVDDGPKITIAALPWSGALGTSPTRFQVIQDLTRRIDLVQKKEKFDLIVTPETSLPGITSAGKAQETLRLSLTSKQGLIFGGVEQKLAGDQFLYFNASVYLQSLPNTDVVMSQKEYLAPFGEVLPSWASLLGFDLLIKRDFIYESGKAQKMVFKEWEFFTAICFEQYLDSYYEDKDQDANFYLVISREFDLPFWAKKTLKGVGEAKALQSHHPILKVSNGNLSEVVAAQYKSQAQGKWVPTALTGIYPLTPNQRISLYYSWGWVLSPIFLIGLVWLLIGIAYSPYYKKY